eukprot:4847497-Pyramimonas_sp.AAC.1
MVTESTEGGRQVALEVVGVRHKGGYVRAPQQAVRDVREETQLRRPDESHDHPELVLSLLRQWEAHSGGAEVFGHPPHCFLQEGQLLQPGCSWVSDEQLLEG